jgi:hypothetical protein
MPFEFFDYDPLTGVKESLSWEDGKLHIQYEQDVEPILDYAKAIQNQGLADDNWRKNGITTYAVLPATVLHAMMKKGIKFLDPNDIGKVLDEINTNYPMLKTTSKTHRVK